MHLFTVTLHVTSGYHSPSLAVIPLSAVRTHIFESLSLFLVV